MIAICHMWAKLWADLTKLTNLTTLTVSHHTHSVSTAQGSLRLDRPSRCPGFQTSPDHHEAGGNVRPQDGADRAVDLHAHDGAVEHDLGQRGITRWNVLMKLCLNIFLFKGGRFEDELRKDQARSNAWSKPLSKTCVKV